MTMLARDEIKGRHMDGLLKTLVAAACLMVLAAGSYYFWSEHKAGQAREAANAALAAQALERARVAKLTSDYCNSIALSALSKVSGKDFRTPDRLADMKTCDQLNRFGYVERRDLNAEGLL